MNRADTAKILAFLESEYPNSFAKMDANQKKVKLELWCSEFANDSFESVYTAMRMYMETEESFAPNIGQLRKRMRLQQEQDEMSEGEAWAMVSKACRNGSYGFKEEFSKLPPIIQKAVGRAEQLREWAAMEESQVQTVIASNFKRDFRAIRERQKEVDSYPQALKDTISKLKIGTAMMDALPEGEENE